MKKFLLPIILLLAVAFFSPQKVNAQTDSECFKEYQNKEYKCLQTRTKCIQSCSSINNLKACQDSCSAQDKTCSDQASADLTACKAAIKKDSENPPKTEASPEVQINTDCHEAFNKESNSCLKENTKCLSSCADKARDAMSLTVDGGKVNLECQRNVCDPSSEACNNKATASFKACLDAGKQPAASEAKQENPKQEGVPVFIGEWFSRFSQAIDGLIALPGAFADVVYEDKFYLAGDFPKLSEMSLEGFYQGNWYPNDDTPDRSPNITVKDEQKAWEVFLPIYIPGEENITVVKGQGEMKMPASSEFIPITTPKGGDTLQVTYLDSVVRSTSDAVQFRHTWSSDSGAVINVPKRSEVKFREPVEVEGFTSHTVELGQGEMEVKVRNNKPAENQFGIDAGWLGVTVSRTHFWISQSQDKKLAVIGVYEGEVEVRTKDGKTIKVKPDGDRPGVMVVSKKLSPVKLALAGVALVVVVGGVILIVKRKLTLKGFSKKKK